MFDMAGSAIYVVPFAVAFATSCVLCYLFVRFHALHAIGSRSDKRRHNERAIPLIGGAAIGAGFLLGSVALSLLGGGPEANRLLCVISALAVALTTGLLDDAYELRARYKLFGQNLVALGLVLALRGLETPPDRLLGQDSLPALALKWFWCLGILNSMNLIDGLDELSSGVAMLVLGFLTIGGLAGSPFHGSLVCVALPALLGFYLWNRHPARIYLGESGAQMGGIFLFLGTMSFRHSPSAAVDTAALFFAMGVPILDTLLAILRRSGRRTGMMTPDREHLHHRMGRLGLSHPNISRFLHAITLYLCGVAYAYDQLSEFSAPALVLAISGLGISLFLLGLAERRLYFYLANFASHMLRTLDENGPDSFTILARRHALERMGTHSSVFRIDLSYCVGNLLEKSPGRIQNFYEKLGEALRGEGKVRETYFENSRSAVVLLLIPPGKDSRWAEALLRDELARFEEREYIDLGLHLPRALQPVPESRPSEVPAAAANAVA